MTKKTKRTRTYNMKYISISLDPVVFTEFKKLCDADGRHVSTTVNALMREYIEEIGRIEKIIGRR